MLRRYPRGLILGFGGKGDGLEDSGVTEDVEESE